jgi:hypothetical protein
MSTNKNSEEPIERTADGMRREYDMSGGERGKYAKDFPRDVVMVKLDPDVAAHFPTSKAVNTALRAIIKAMESISVKESA